MTGREGEELTNCCSVRTGSWVARPCRSRGRRSLFVRRRSFVSPCPTRLAPDRLHGAAHSQRVISCSCSSSSSSCSCSAGPGVGASGSAASPCSLATACLPRAFCALPLRLTGALLLAVAAALVAAAWLAGARRRSCERDDMSWRDSTESRTRAVGLRMRPPTMVSFRLASDSPSEYSLSRSESERAASLNRLQRETSSSTGSPNFVSALSTRVQRFKPRTRLSKAPSLYIARPSPESPPLRVEMGHVPANPTSILKCLPRMVSLA